MAQGKKSFLVYLDSRNLVDKLSNERAGKLFKTLLSYCADENPIVEDEVVDMVFEHFKGILKRDLKKYESIVERNVKNGGFGGRPKKEETQNNPVGLLETQITQANPKKPDTDTDTDTDTDILLKKETKENTFEIVWSLYGKKGNRKTSFDKFSKLKELEIKNILNHVPIYIASIKDKQFIKNFETYLNQRHWETEINGIDILKLNNKENQIEYVTFSNPAYGTEELPRNKFESLRKNYAEGGYIFTELKTEWR